MKLVAPGNSRLSFMRMLDAQTTECGRVGCHILYVYNIYHCLLIIVHTYNLNCNVYFNRLVKCVLTHSTRASWSG